MISLVRPSPARIARFVDAQRTAPFSYPEVGATRGEPPPGYHVDRSEVAIGRGETSFTRAKAALAELRHYDAPRGRIRVVEPRPALAEGAVVALLGCHFGIWTLSACRVVYVFDEPRSFGFAYGTLEHAVRGEERFEVDLAADGRVVFRLFAFSVPAATMVRIGSPLARHFQRRAGRDYGDALRVAIETRPGASTL